MQSFIVLASLVFEIAGGQNDPLTLQKHLTYHFLPPGGMGAPGIGLRFIKICCFPPTNVTNIFCSPL